MATFDEIHDAFLFVSSDEYGMNRALLCLDNGEIYYHSEMETSMSWMKTNLTAIIFW